MNKVNPILIFFISISLLLFLGCQKEELSLEEESKQNEYQLQRFIESFSDQENDTGSIDFNLPDQVLDTEKKAEEVFMNKISGYGQDHIVKRGGIFIKDNRLKVDLPSEYGTKNGLVCRIEVPDRDGYQLEFEVAFHSQFSFAKEGKVGLGFAIGEGVTGGKENKIAKKLGGSFRVIWYRHKDGKHYLVPYVYYQDMSEKYGTDFQDNKYLITQGKKYNVRLSIKTNTGPRTEDGYAKMEVKSKYESNYTTVWEKNDIEWCSNESEAMRKITKIYFNVFRGGTGSNYNGNNGTRGVYFDNFAWRPY